MLDVGRTSTREADPSAVILPLVGTEADLGSALVRMARMAAAVHMGEVAAAHHMAPAPSRAEHAGRVAAGGGA